MSWNSLPPEARAIAERELSPRQLDVFKLWMAGCGYKRIGVMLDISPSTARDHLARALQKLRPHMQRAAA